MREAALTKMSSWSNQWSDIGAPEQHQLARSDD